MNKCFSLKPTVGLAAILLACSVVPPGAKGSGKPSNPCPGVNATTIIADSDINGNPFQLQSDGLGAYVTYNNSKTDQLTSVIQGGSCDWLLSATSGASRTVAFTFDATNQASGPPAPPPFTGTQKVSPYIISKCHLNTANNGITYGTMTFAGQTLQCGISAAFSYGGSDYAVKMEPDNFPGTYWAQVTCTGVTPASPAQCNAWTVTPQPGLVTNPSTGQVSSIGELVRITTSKGQTVYTSLGLYYVAFYITIHE